MHQKRYGIMSILAIITLLTLALGSLNQPVTAADSDPNTPGEINSKNYRTIYDQTDEKTASKKEAFGGDVFGLGWYERPFDQSMGYMPFIDISEVRLHRDDPNWIYVQIFVVGNIADGSNLKPMFGVELDTDLDNRGEFLLLASAPRGTEWSTDGVVIYSNSDNRIGGNSPVLVDKKTPGNKGYDTEVFNSGKGQDSNLAWARISPTNPRCMDLAFKNLFVGGEKGKFIWFPWTLVGMKDMTKFEFNDHISMAEAGSPTKQKAALVHFNGFVALTTSGDDYPLNGLWGIDNTPRYPSGFFPNGSMPGMGPLYEPTYSPPSRPDKNAPPPPM
jgi:hypothetical protein